MSPAAKATITRQSPIVLSVGLAISLVTILVLVSLTYGRDAQRLDTVEKDIKTLKTCQEIVQGDLTDILVTLARIEQKIE